ncbi:MAG TPA: aminoacyl-tRNA hydrolase [Rhodospirillaceae bacterium]|nr:aminoacyl-tRNA hydrolase [Candidatus Neomarinimicrobiota bacterium]HCX14138.1 aminoacyl-tRNA hydrolase [Rhodospirillaceae bacterium]
MSLRTYTIPVTSSIYLDERELVFNFIRASGPGGQNVNKIATAVQLRFDAANSTMLSDAVRRRVLRLAGRRATLDGVIVIEANRFRTQERNRVDAVNRLVDLIRRAAITPKKRVPTQPSKSSRSKRLESKRRRSAIKGKRTVQTGDWD